MSNSEKKTKINLGAMAASLPVIGAKAAPLPPASAFPDASPFKRLVDDFLERGQAAINAKTPVKALGQFDRIALMALGGVPITFWLENGEIRLRMPAGFELVRDDKDGKYLVNAIDVGANKEDPKKKSNKFTKVYK